MRISIFCFLVFAINLSRAYNCKDRNCFVTRNENNETIFDCKLEKIEQDLVRCFYFPKDHKFIITTKDESLVRIDRIATGAFKRLVSGVIVDKIYFKKFQLPILDSTDFDGLVNISEMRIENPTTLNENTFLSLARKKNFILTISCTDGHKGNSFDSINLKSEQWTFYSENCDREMSCEIYNCHKHEDFPSSKIYSSDQPASNYFRLNSLSCGIADVCQRHEATPKPVARPKIILPTSSSQLSSSKSKSINITYVSNYYATLLWVVLILTGMNSVVIMGILLFLVFWWRTLSSSAADKKHTIILENGEDSKYLKLGPFS